MALRVRRVIALKGDSYAQPADVGTYALAPHISVQEPRCESDVRCPYCHQKTLGRKTDRMYQRRVKQVGIDLFETIDIPQTFDVVACIPCDARFVVPKNRSEWPMTFDAAGQP